VLDDLDGHVDIVLDGGSTPIGLESTVLDLTGSTPSVLRPGGVALEALRQVVPTLELGQRFVKSEKEAALSSPGMLAKHYSPSARFLLFTGSSEDFAQRYLEAVRYLVKRGGKVGLMIFDEDAAKFSGLDVEVARLGSETDLTAIGQNLFARMRDLEKKNVDTILMRAMRSQGLGVAIWDRLFRAADGKVYELDGEVDVETLLRLAGLD
jgi:L-threonylcarbamoyladenylate synthase